MSNVFDDVMIILCVEPQRRNNMYSLGLRSAQGLPNAAQVGACVRNEDSLYLVFCCVYLFIRVLEV